VERKSDDEGGFTWKCEYTFFAPPPEDTGAAAANDSRRRRQQQPAEKNQKKMESRQLQPRCHRRTCSPLQVARHIGKYHNCCLVEHMRCKKELSDALRERATTGQWRAIDRLTGLIAESERKYGQKIGL
jgi:hypothetical protein